MESSNMLGSTVFKVRKIVKVHSYFQAQISQSQEKNGYELMGSYGQSFQNITYAKSHEKRGTQHKK